MQEALHERSSMKQSELPATLALETFLQLRETSSRKGLTPASSCLFLPVQQSRKRSFGLAGMFRATEGLVDGYAMEFPSIEWCNDDNDEHDTSDNDKTPEPKRLAPENSTAQVAPSNKQRKLHTHSVPYLVRSKTLTSGLALLRSSDDGLSKGISPVSTFCSSGYTTPAVEWSHPATEMAKLPLSECLRHFAGSAFPHSPNERKAG